jgi:hypothetical protein
MKPRITAGLVVLVHLTLLVSRPASAVTTFATGSDSDPAADCHYSSVTAQLSATGALSYTVYGDCGGAPIGGHLSYDPRAQAFSEKFFNSVNFEDSGSCPADPWTTGAVCSGQKVAARSADPKLNEILRPEFAPYSRGVPASASLFQNAFAHATRPNPPGAPVNAAAKTTVLWTSVQVRWLAPDESGNRPFVQFMVQARPQGAAGAAWSTLGDVPRQGTYDVTFRLPPRVAGYSAWEIRTCSVTALTQSCTGALTPEVTSNALTRPSTQSFGATQHPTVTGVTAHTGATAGVSSQGTVSPPPVASPNPILTRPLQSPLVAPATPNPILTRPSQGKPVPPPPATKPVFTKPQPPANPQAPATTAPPSALHPAGSLN